MISTPTSSDPGPPSPSHSPENPKGVISRTTSIAGESKKERKIGHRRVTEEGTVTYKKKTTLELQHAIQLGIQYQVGLVQRQRMRDVLQRDFTVMETISFPRAGSQTTPAHTLSDFKFVSYAPIVFRCFQARYKLKILDFLNSVCCHELRELSNPGASGSIFYITHDDVFIIKTVQHREGEFLQSLLPPYFMNLMQHYRTLLPKFYGYYHYRTSSKNIRFVIMNNLMPSSVKMHEKYDLKGSLYKRRASAKELQKSSPTLKDLDFRERHPTGILLEASTYNFLYRSIERDCLVLESLKIMDYSLLLCVHNLDEAKRERLAQTKRSSQDELITQPSHSTASGGDDIASASPSNNQITHQPTGLPVNGGSGGGSWLRPSDSRPGTSSAAQSESSSPPLPASRSKVTFVPLASGRRPSEGDVTPPPPTQLHGSSRSNFGAATASVGFATGSGGGLPVVRPATTALQREVRKEKSKRRITAYCTAMESIAANAQPVDLEHEELELIISGGILARSGKGERLLLFMGIIDILQSYRFTKKVEHSFKALFIDRQTISVAPPSFYKRRFQDSLFKCVFKPVESLDHPNLLGPNARRFRRLVEMETMKQHAANSGKLSMGVPPLGQPSHFPEGQGRNAVTDPRSRKNSPFVLSVIRR